MIYYLVIRAFYNNFYIITLRITAKCNYIILWESPEINYIIPYFLNLFIVNYILFFVPSDIYIIS